MATFMMISLALVAGCLSRRPLTTEHFSLGAKPPAAAAQPAFDDVLGLRNIIVAPEFDQRFLIYRTSETSYERDAYAQWLVPPERMLGGAVRQWLRASKLFRDVAEPNSSVQPTRTAELQVMELAGDFRRANEPAAVLTIRFVLLERDSNNSNESGRIAFSREYSKRIPMRERSAAGVVQALEQGLNETLAELGSDLTQGRASK